jgi:hypothetical protein
MARSALVHRIGRVVLYPVGVVLVLWWRYGPDLPRRVPSLFCLARGPGFRRLRRTVTGWVDEHFRLIEAHAGRLEVAGQEVTDFCVSDLTTTRGFRFPRVPPSVRCQRSVVRVYGTDGPLEARLDELAAALAAAGWGQPDGDRIVPLDGDQLHRRDCSIAWRPVPGARFPAGLETQPPTRQFPSWRWLRMEIDRVPGGLAPGQWQVPGITGPQPARRRSAICRVLEHTTSKNNADPVTGAAQRRHDHAIAIKITFTYYNNSNVSRPPGWIPRRLLPVRTSTYRRLSASGLQ